uniref:tRNA(Ile)-lysidine synthase n=1 Tax=Candidatus Kentrum sp. TUN TaxID=2126343 RepID=A0A450ZLW5_9GAMM|nr:MAG: tRNA(Ile)-lysidine synthase [Candidatus Kentron sp. TUN]VFK54809.1 MAG: tRNA(Ile)-lysidine synthase [Candidatus Kentron sp. TUN]VFK63237.1 MAG: tRNA(Ile)-lysidine synthase [Candidatus Kentron sp. TUN]
MERNKQAQPARNRDKFPEVSALILNELRRMPKTRRYRIAYSGGADSHALLQAVATLRDTLGGAEVLAVHVNHGLQADADRWADHAMRVCRHLGIACQILVADVHSDPGESPEAAARRIRYGAIKEIMETDEVLLTAHHLDDQAETLLLQMIRGAGPHGLAAMPLFTRFGVGWLGRPLLGVSGGALREYARSRGLCWVEDHSNNDNRFDRNYLRHEILPRLRDRWPAVADTLGRVAAHQAQAARQLDRLAEEDLTTLSRTDRNVLSCEGLRHLPTDRQRNLLTAWFRQLKLPAPNAIHIERILAEIIDAAPDREPLVCWKGVEVRRYRDNLYAGTPLPVRDSSRIIHWPLMRGPLLLSHGRLEAYRARGRGLRAASCPENTVEVRFRQGGERCRTAARGCTHRLKKLFQERGIAPWERDRNPLIFIAGQLVVVAGLWVCHPFEASGDEPGWVFRWFPDHDWKSPASSL